MDVDHADKMRDIVVSLATDESTCLEMAYAVDRILNAHSTTNAVIDTLSNPTAISNTNVPKFTYIPILQCTIVYYYK